MATNWATIISAAMVPIDDIRLQEQLSISPALFYRGMSLYVKNALPMLSKPPALLTYLKEGMEEPTYADYYWTSTEASTQAETVVDTGAIGYEICSCIIYQTLDDGRTMQTPYAVDYNSETGMVTFPVQTAAGINYELDFYTDGNFNDMSEAQIRLYGQAISVVWDERFTGAWLNRQPKINDSSFMTVNEANWTEKTSQAHLRKAQAFYEELKQYEQLCAYKSVVMESWKGMVSLV